MEAVNSAHVGLVDDDVARTGNLKRVAQDLGCLEATGAVAIVTVPKKKLRMVRKSTAPKPCSYSVKNHNHYEFEPVNREKLMHVHTPVPMSDLIALAKAARNKARECNNGVAKSFLNK